MMPDDDQNIWEKTLSEVKNNIEEGVNVWEENNKNSTDTVKALIQQLRQMVIVAKKFLAPEAVAVTPITYQILRSNYQLLRNNKPTIWAWTGNDLRYFDTLISEQIQKIETVVQKHRERNQQRQAPSPNPAPVSDPNVWDQRFREMQDQFNKQQEITNTKIQQIEKAKEDEITSIKQTNATLQETVEKLVTELEASKSQALVIKNQESQLAIMSEDNRKLKGILEVILSTLKDSGITMETIEGKSIEEVQKIIAEKQQLLLSGFQREAQSINHHARYKYNELGEIFAYSEPPRNLQEQERWKRAMPKDYQKYKLDICVSPATYYSMLKLAEYENTLTAGRSPVLNGHSAADERELVSNLIYTLALQELESNISIEQNIETSKQSFVAEGGSEGCQALLDRILEDIERYKLPKLSPKTTELGKKVLLLEQFSAGSEILPQNDTMRKKFINLKDKYPISVPVNTRNTSTLGSQN